MSDSDEKNRNRPKVNFQFVECEQGSFRNNHFIDVDAGIGAIRSKQIEFCYLSFRSSSGAEPLQNLESRLGALLKHLETVARQHPGAQLGIDQIIAAKRELHEGTATGGTLMSMFTVLTQTIQAFGAIPGLRVALHEVKEALISLGAPFS